MDSKALLAVMAVVLLSSAYNSYNVYIMSQSISSISGELRELSEGSQMTESLTRTADYSSFLEVKRSIPIVAVSSDGKGVVGNLTVRLIPGNNNVLINTNPFK